MVKQKHLTNMVLTQFIYAAENELQVTHKNIKPQYFKNASSNAF